MSATIGPMVSLTRGSASGVEAAARAELVGVDERHPPRKLEGRLSALEGALEDLVVHVGHVAHVGDAIAPRAKEANEDVERDERARVPDVRVVVRREPADVEAHVARLERLERLHPLGHRVVEADGARGHGGSFHSPKRSQ